MVTRLPVTEKIVGSIPMCPAQTKKILKTESIPDGWVQGRTLNN